MSFVKKKTEKLSIKFFGSVSVTVTFWQLITETFSLKLWDVIKTFDHIRLYDASRTREGRKLIKRT